MALLCGYLPKDYEEMTDALLEAFRFAIDGKDPYAVMQVLRRGKRLNNAIEGAIAKLIAGYSRVLCMEENLQWERVEDVPPLEDLALEPSVVTVIPDSITLEEAIDYARARGHNLGYADAEHVLDDPEFLLLSWFEGKTFLFPGTVWKDRDGRKYVLTISKDARGWGKNFQLLEGRAKNLFVFQVRAK